jgi:hypothetical protein
MPAVNGPATATHAHTTAGLDHPEHRLAADRTGVPRWCSGRRQDGRRLVMAQINVSLKTRKRWWLMPLLNCAVVWCWLAGRDEIAPGFIDWLVRYGLIIEVE